MLVMMRFRSFGCSLIQMIGAREESSCSHPEIQSSHTRLEQVEMRVLAPTECSTLLGGLGSHSPALGSLGELVLVAYLSRHRCR